MRYLIVIGVILAVIVTYMIVAASQPVVNEIIESANTSTNWTGFEETQAMVTSYPLYLWAIPGVVGLVAIIYYLKFWNRSA